MESVKHILLTGLFAVGFWVAFAPLGSAMAEPGSSSKEASYETQLNRLVRVLTDISLDDSGYINVPHGLSNSEANSLNSKTIEFKREKYIERRDELLKSDRLADKLSKELAKHFFPNTEYSSLRGGTKALFKSLVLENRSWSDLLSPKGRPGYGLIVMPDFLMINKSNAESSNNWVRVNEVYDKFLCSSPVSRRANQSIVENTLNNMGRVFGNPGTIYVNPNATHTSSSIWKINGKQVAIESLSELAEAVISDSQFVSCQMRFLWKLFSRSYREPTSDELSSLQAEYFRVNGRTRDLLKWIVSQKPFIKFGGRSESFQRDVDNGFTGAFGPNCYSPREAMIKVQKTLKASLTGADTTQCRQENISTGSVFSAYSVANYEACYSNLVDSFVGDEFGVVAHSMVDRAIRIINSNRLREKKNTAVGRETHIQFLTEAELYDIARLMAQSLFKSSQLIRVRGDARRSHYFKFALVEDYGLNTSDSLINFAIQAASVNSYGNTVNWTIKNYFKKLLKTMLLSEEYLCH